MICNCEDKTKNLSSSLIHNHKAPNEKSTCISQMLFTISIIPPRTKSTNKRQVREMRIEI